MTFPTGGFPPYAMFFTAPDRNGIFYEGDTITLTNDGGAGYQLIPGRTYEVRDYKGNIVSSGSLTEFQTVHAPTPPVGGWKCGWYRYYCIFPDPHPNHPSATYGAAGGAYNFVVVRNTPGFATNTPTAPTTGGDESRDVVMKGVMGMGFSRLQIYPDDLTSFHNPLEYQVAEAEAMAAYRPQDTVRPWTLMCQMPYEPIDRGVIDFSGFPDAPQKYFFIYPRSADLDPGQIFFSADESTDLDNISADNFTIYYPDASTPVEVYTDLSINSFTRVAEINNNSDYVYVIHGFADYAATTPPTAIGRTKLDGTAELVQTLLPLGVTRYEGPENEPVISHDDIVLKMKIFQGNVHAAHPDAVAIGPCAVSLDFVQWRAFLEMGGGDYCDEFSTHMYNSQTAGDINLGRSEIRGWLDLLEEYGYEDKLGSIWSTESTHVFTSVYGVYHPRNARVPLLQTLLLEQFGVPRERNHVWYDISHGFWSYPSWTEMSDGSLNPYAALYRCLTEETFELNHHHPLDFGSVQGNSIFLGSVYGDGRTRSSTAVIIAQSYVPDATVTLNIVGTTDDITIVDGWGNESTVAQSSGRIVVPADEIPTYVRLPQGVHCWVYSCNDWGPAPPPSISQFAQGRLAGDVRGEVSDGKWLQSYALGVGIAYGAPGPSSMPDEATLMFSELVDVDRVIIWCASPWQSSAGLIDFDIETTTNGTDWTVRKTVTKTTPSSFVYPTFSSNAGCTRETYMDAQWIFDETLPSTYACTGIRVTVRATTWGGEPDEPSITGGLGQGDYQKLVLTEIAVPSTSIPGTFANPYHEEVLADNPVGYWRLGETTGTTAVSQVNSPTLDGVYTNQPDLGVTGALSDGDTAFAPGGSATGYGYMKVTSNALLDVGDTFTLEFWADTASETRSAAYLTSKGRTGGVGSFHVRFVLGKLTLYYDGQFNEHPGEYIAQAPYVGDAGWHHYAITKDGTDTHIYIDGADETILGVNYTFTNSTAALAVGATSAVDQPDIFEGNLDEYALYGHVLSGARVLAHYESSPTPGAVPTIRKIPVLA